MALTFSWRCRISRRGSALRCPREPELRFCASAPRFTGRFLPGARLWRPAQPSAPKDERASLLRRQDWAPRKPLPGNGGGASALPSVHPAEACAPPLVIRPRVPPAAGCEASRGGICEPGRGPCSMASASVVVCRVDERGCEATSSSTAKLELADFPPPRHCRVAQRRGERVLAPRPHVLRGARARGHRRHHNDPQAVVILLPPKQYPTQNRAVPPLPKPHRPPLGARGEAIPGTTSTLQVARVWVCGQHHRHRPHTHR